MQILAKVTWIATLLAVATAGGHSGAPTKTTSSYAPKPTSQCSTGTIECCDSVADADSPVVALLLSLLNIIVPGDTPIGVTCSPITVGAGGQSECNETPVCCDNNGFNGVVAIGCTPIKINI